MKDNGWISIEMVEIQGRRWEARQKMVRQLDDAIERLRDVKKRKLEGIEKKRQYYLEHGQQQSDDDVVPEKVREKRKIQEQEMTKVTKTEFNPFGRGLRIKEGDEQYDWVKVSKNETEIKSHTSYLTFAFKAAPLSR